MSKRLTKRVADGAFRFSMNLLRWYWTQCWDQDFEESYYTVKAEARRFQEARYGNTFCA